MKEPLPDFPRVAAGDMELQLMEMIEIGETDFNVLAVARANRVKEYLLQTGKMEPERVFLAEAATRGKDSTSSRVYLHLR